MRSPSLALADLEEGVRWLNGWNRLAECPGKPATTWEAMDEFELAATGRVNGEASYALWGGRGCGAHRRYKSNTISVLNQIGVNIFFYKNMVRILLVCLC